MQRWCFAAAVGRFHRIAWPLLDLPVGGANVRAPRPGRALDVVVAQCRGDAGWAAEVSWPRGTRFYFVRKCADVPVLAEVFAGYDVRTIDAVDLDTSGRADECSAYLAFLRDESRADDARFALFVHDDAPNHLTPSLLQHLRDAVL